MGDISEMRALVVVGIFVGLSVILVTLMASQSPTLFTGETGTSGVAGTSHSPTDILAWNQTYTFNITSSTTNYDIPNLGCGVTLFKWSGLAQSVPHLRVESYDTWWFLTWAREDFLWYNYNNTAVSIRGTSAEWPWPGVTNEYTIMPWAQLDADYSAAGTNGLRYVLRNSRTQFTIQFGFNTTAFQHPSQVLTSSQSLYATLNQDFADRPSSINALSFISGLFTFSLPGVPTIISVILWLMIVPPLAYLTFIFILRIVGAIFGGGGA